MCVISSVSGILIEGKVHVAKSNVIELNGKRYDAVTGTFLGEAPHTPSHNRIAKSTGHRGRSIDGFVKPPKQVNTNAAHATAFIPVHPAPKPEQKPIAHSPAKHVSAHQPERAKTLMRSVVKKPKIDKKPAIKTQAPAEVMPKPLGTIAPKLSVTQVNPSRLEHAQETPKSEAIKKFAAPARQLAPVSRASIAAPVRRTSVTPTRPHAAVQTPQQTSKLHAPAQVTTPKRDIFEEALAHATSHEQKHPAATSRKQRNHRRRLVNVLAGITAFLIIGGFVAYLNAPSIELRIASVRAGFHASLPTYEPVGYAMSRGVGSHNKQVTVSFHSDNGTGFQLTQEPSNWDSSTLYDNLVATTNKNHQTIESGGRTIYLFGDTNAAWVNAGVLYQIKGNAELSNNQISELAASM